MDIYVLCEQVLHTNTTSYNEFRLYKKKKKKVIGIFSEESNGQKKKDSGMFKLEEEGHIQKQEIERLRTKKLNFSKGCRVDISMPYFRKGVQKLKFGISTKSL